MLAVKKPNLSNILKNFEQNSAWKNDDLDKELFLLAEG
jgi:hypothetical protein